MRNIFILIFLIYIVPISAVIIFNNGGLKITKSDLHNEINSQDKYIAGESNIINDNDSNLDNSNEIKPVSVQNSLNANSNPTSNNSDPINTPVISSNIPVVENNPPPETIKTVHLKIEGVGEYKVDYINGDTAYDVLKRASLNNNIPLKYKNYGSMGVFVDCINNICQNKNQYWALIYNGNFSHLGASILKVNPNDTILWQYQNM